MVCLLAGIPWVEVINGNRGNGYGLKSGGD